MIQFSSLLFAVPLLLAGCAGGSGISAPKVHWVTNIETDQFSDKTTCTVTMGSLYTNTAVYDMANNFYPFVSKMGNDVRVGVRSGGKYRIPVGDVQLRVDQNPAITISTAETPVDLAPQQAMPAPPQGLSPEQQKIVESSYASSMATISKAMSPYTATTGEKAAQILAQLKSGKSLIYRKVGLNQAASTTGEVELDSSFGEGLGKCGIN